MKGEYVPRHVVPPLNKKKAIRKMREGQYVNISDNDVASHKMAWTGDPNKKRGKYGVFPTIAPVKGKESSHDPKDWKEQSREEATERGEFIRVRSKRKAVSLAGGSWKK